VQIDFTWTPEIAQNSIGLVGERHTLRADESLVHSSGWKAVSRWLGWHHSTDTRPAERPGQYSLLDPKHDYLLARVTIEKLDFIPTPTPSHRR